MTSSPRTFREKIISQRSTAYAHTHIHACAIDGVFSQGPDCTLRFHRASALTDSDIAAVEVTTRARVLRLFEREGL